MSILLTIYLLFLITFVGMIGFALFRAWTFSKEPAIAGRSMIVATGFIVVAVIVIGMSFVGLSQFRWNDDLSFYVGAVKKVMKPNVK